MSLRLPMLVRYPPLARQGTVVKELVLSLDLAPTLLDVCSAKPLLEGAAKGWRSAFFYQYNYEAQFPDAPNVRVAWTADWKYIRYPHGDGKADRHAARMDVRVRPATVRERTPVPRDGRRVRGVRHKRTHGMTPLYRDPHFTFRFAEDRLIPRFHLDGIEPGRRVAVYRLDPQTGGPADLMVRAVTGEGGWVDLPEPLVVRAGEGFVAVPEADLLVRPETPTDHAAVREVNRLAFGQDDEADLVDALRAGGYARLSLVAEQDGAVVGHLLFSRLPVETTTGTVEALALAPMGVRPGRQRQGVGSQLIRGGLAVCRDRGHRIVVVLGHVEYYPRFGFSAALAERLRSPFPGPHFLALELVPGALTGVEGEVRYPPPFGVG